jgi:hypothetical protein
MKKIGRIYVLFVVGMFVSVSFSAAFSEDSPENEPEEITICQTSTGIPETITILKADLDAHLAAGDTVGPCEGEELEKIDHFKCYLASGQSYINETVKLEDQFIEEVADVLYVTEFCNPVEKIHDGNQVQIKNQDAHLTLYQIQTPTVPDRVVTVSNQFGEDQSIEVSQPFALFVPTQKIPHEEPTGLDHFKCYEAGGKSANAMVYLKDQFGVKNNVSVLVPFMFCTPVEKTHAGVVTPIENPKAHLLCYGIYEGSINKMVTIKNQFTDYDRLTLYRADALCVPTVKEEPEAEKLDHFKCYTVMGWQTIKETVLLKDQFGEGKADVLDPTEFCTPVEKTHDGKVVPIKNPNAHLTKYVITTPSVPDRKVLVSNQFGENMSLVVSQPFALMVPTQKYPHPEPTGLDHYKCYEVSGKSVKAMVSLRDQFKIEENVTVLEPIALCTPVEKTHAGVVTPIENPDDHLVCYAIKGGPFYKYVSYRNQFADYGYFYVRQSQELCVPSEKEEVEEEKELDHFKCYLIWAPGGPANAAVALSDQFGKNNARVDIPYLFCNPVEKSHWGEVTPITNPDAHLKMYFINTYGGYPITYVPPSPNVPAQVVVNNQFGEEQELNVGQPLFLATPTQKYPHNPPSGLDHFQCYAVSGKSLYDMVDLKDQFGIERYVRVYNPLLLCNPVVKTHNYVVTPVENPDDHLVCYGIQRRQYYRYMITADQFRTELLVARDSVLLCVPSAKKVPAPEYPNIQQLCGDHDAGDFDGGMVLPGNPGTGLYKDDPNATWPAGRPRRPCGEYVPIDGFLPPAGVNRFRVAYRKAGDPIPAPGDPTTLTIQTKWILRDRNPGPFCAVNPAHILETDADGWMDASLYLEAKNGGPSTDFCTNSGLRLAVWDTKGLDAIGGDSNGHYVVWLEWDDGAMHSEPYEHHIQLDNTKPVINDLCLRLEDGVTPIGPCGGTGPINGTLTVFADFEDDYYWGYRLRIRGGDPPSSKYYGWHYYYDGTPEVANTDTTGTFPDATTVYLRDVDLNDLNNFTDCCYVLDLWVRDSAIRHSFNHRYANDISGSSTFWANDFLTFAAMPSP